MVVLAGADSVPEFDDVWLEFELEELSELELELEELLSELELLGASFFFSSSISSVTSEMSGVSMVFAASVASGEGSGTLVIPTMSTVAIAMMAMTTTAAAAMMSTLVFEECFAFVGLGCGPETFWLLPGLPPLLPGASRMLPPQFGQTEVPFGRLVLQYGQYKKHLLTVAIGLAILSVLLYDAKTTSAIRVRRLASAM